MRKHYVRENGTLKYAPYGRRRSKQQKSSPSRHHAHREPHPEHATSPHDPRLRHPWVRVARNARKKREENGGNPRR